MTNQINLLVNDSKTLAAFLLHNFQAKKLSLLREKVLEIFQPGHTKIKTEIFHANTAKLTHKASLDEY